MSEKLQFSIGVDLSELDAGLNDAGKEIKKFTDANKRQFERAGLAVAGLGASIVAIAQDVGGAGSQISRTFENIANAISEGDIPTLIGLVTSAIGILIGLIPTIVSGIALIRTAFAALSLTLSANPIGAVVAAIGLAIVGVIAAVQLFSNSVEKLAVKKDLLNQVSEMAVKSLAKEKSELVSLLAVAKDVEIPYEQRLKAVKKLNEISPEYLGNITLENLETRNTIDAINAYSEALIKKAKAQAANKLLNENIEKQLQLELEYDKRLKGSIKTLSKELEARMRATMSEEAFMKVKANMLSLNGKINKQKEAEFAVLKREEEDILKLIRAYEGYDISLKKVAETKKLVNTPQVSGIDLPQPLGIAPQVSEAMSVGYIDQAVAAADLGAVRIAEVMYNFNREMDTLVMGSLMSTFSTLGTVIGDALASGGNIAEAIGQGILKSFGGFISEMGDLLIKYGVLAKVKGSLDEAIKAGGFVAIAGGALAIATGIALKVAGAAISSKAGSGFSGGRSIGNAGGSSSSNISTASFSSFSAQSNNEVVFRIAGSDLLGVLRRAEGNEQRLG